jgi:methionine-rich copper-binding protein CopC
LQAKAFPVTLVPSDSSVQFTELSRDLSSVTALTVQSWDTNTNTLFAAKWCAAAVLLSCAANAQAHAHLTASVPADGTTGTAPEHIVLTFSEAVRITAMTLQREGEEARKVVPLPTAAAAQLTIPLPKLAPGKYTLSWRVLGEDGHMVSGALHFTVAALSRGTASGAHGR